jgi:hypothetical protein
MHAIMFYPFAKVIELQFYNLGMGLVLATVARAQLAKARTYAYLFSSGLNGLVDSNERRRVETLINADRQTDPRSKLRSAKNRKKEGTSRLLFSPLHVLPPSPTGSLRNTRDSWNPIRVFPLTKKAYALSPA